MLYVVNFAESDETPDFRYFIEAEDMVSARRALDWANIGYDKVYSLPYVIEDVRMSSWQIEFLNAADAAIESPKDWFLSADQILTSRSKKLNAMRVKVEEAAKNFLSAITI